MPSTRSSQRCKSAHGTARRFSSATSASDSSPMKRLGPTNFEATERGRSFVVSIPLAKSRIDSIDRSIAKMSPETAVGLGEKFRSGADLRKTAASRAFSVCPPQVKSVPPFNCQRAGSYPLRRASDQMMLRLVGRAGPVRPLTGSAAPRPEDRPSSSSSEATSRCLVSARTAPSARRQSARTSLDPKASPLLAQGGLRPRSRNGLPMPRNQQHSVERGARPHQASELARSSHQPFA